MKVINLTAHSVTCENFSFHPSGIIARVQEFEWREPLMLAKMEADYERLPPFCEPVNGVNVDSDTVVFDGRAVPAVPLIDVMGEETVGLPNPERGTIYIV